MTGLRVEQLTIGRKYRDRHGRCFLLDEILFGQTLPKASGRALNHPGHEFYLGSDEGSGPFLPFGPGPEDLPALLIALETFRARELPQECASAIAFYDRVIAPLVARLRQA